MCNVRHVARAQKSMRAYFARVSTQVALAAALFVASTAFNPYLATAQSPRSFEGGNSSWMSILMQDEAQAFSKIYQCAKVTQVGLCTKVVYAWFQIHIYIAPYWEYYLPVAQFEAADQPFRTAMMPSSIVNSYMKSPLKSTFYSLLKADVKQRVKRSAGEAAWVMKMMGGSDDGSVFVDDKVVEDAKTDVEALDDKLEFRNPDSNTGGITYAENRYMPFFWAYEASKQIVSYWIQIMSPQYDINMGYIVLHYGTPSPYVCHDSANGMMRASEDILAAYYTRNEIAAYYPAADWLKSMLSLFGDPFTGTMGNPFGCFKSPPSNIMMKLVGKILRLPADACVGVGAGPAFPFRPFASNVAHFTSAALNAFAKANEVNANAPLKIGSPYIYRRKPGGSKADMLQWTQNQKIKSATGGSCVAPERDFASFGAANDRSDNSPENMWAIANHWKYFRCCPSGYMHMVTWSGDNTDIKK